MKTYVNLNLIFVWTWMWEPYKAIQRIDGSELGQNLETLQMYKCTCHFSLSQTWRGQSWFEMFWIHWKFTRPQEAGGQRRWNSGHQNRFMSDFSSPLSAPDVFSCTEFWFLFLKRITEAFIFYLLSGFPEKEQWPPGTNYLFVKNKIHIGHSGQVRSGPKINIMWQKKQQ